MAEQVKRTIGAKPGPKIGAKKPDAGAKDEAPAAAEPEGKKKGGLKKILIMAVAAVVLVGAGVGAAVMILKPDVAPAAAGEVVPAEAAPVELGDVVTVEPVSVNLAGSRYLRLGFAMQLSAASEKSPDVSRARDIGIATFSGREMALVNDTANRDALKTEFLENLQGAFGAENVVDVYYTDFVTQ